MKAAAPGLDARELFTELRERLAEEVDYVREAEAQTAFADAYRDDADIAVLPIRPSEPSGDAVGRAPAWAAHGAGEAHRPVSDGRSESAVGLVARSALAAASADPGWSRMTF